MLFLDTDSVLGSDFRELIDIDNEEVDGSVVFREAKVFVQKGHAHARPGGDEVDDCEVVDYSLVFVLCEQVYGSHHCVMCRVLFSVQTCEGGTEELFE